ncbi:ABC transporter substrate-binding protein [Sphingomonas sp. C3-2]|uniref:ABC transporter substrate-binding protein n=1 Tax=Sphingomonas sp. C3-2 TaxID=3062169 RepID=UPI00294B559B|nr:ABC transporter substrate-binding protein [Sphingomonas sp. C3-2]WOK37473.1 ABC transporter substrate-binding protein [Sphingomonas sp. C3-2]
MFQSLAALFASLLALIGLGPSAERAAQPVGVTAPAYPLRVVSLNMCADQYLIELADRRQIAALSEYARDPKMSFHARAAAAYPVSAGSAEELLALQPDLIIGSDYQRAGVEALFRNHPVAFVEFGLANSQAEMIAQARSVAAALGQQARGEDLVRRLGVVGAVQAGTARPVVAYYQRRGFLTGTGTLVDDILTRAGADNLARRLNKPMLAQLSLEEMVAARPDFLLVDAETAQVADQGTEMLHHPALRVIPRLSLSEALTVCGGPSYPLAVENLRRQIAAAAAS